MMNESNKTQIFLKLKLLLNYWKLYACVYHEDTAEGQRSRFLHLAKPFNRQLGWTCTDTFSLRSGGATSEKQLSSRLVMSLGHFSPSPRNTKYCSPESVTCLTCPWQAIFGCSRPGFGGVIYHLRWYAFFNGAPNFPNTKLYSVALTWSRSAANSEPDAVPSHSLCITPNFSSWSTKTGKPFRG